ncbi:hypothetical protein D3C87_933520 [compost metagenome]
MLIIAFARSAWSLSNTGSPSPTGTCLTTAEMRPPTVSPAFLTESINSTISLAVAGSAQRAILDSRSSRRALRSLVSKLGASIVPTPETCAKISMPNCCKKLLATAPAATRAAVSRAEERPPPR